MNINYTYLSKSADGSNKPKSIVQAILIDEALVTTQIYPHLY
jgi:hypothetical protein